MRFENKTAQMFVHRKGSESYRKDLSLTLKRSSPGKLPTLTPSRNHFVKLNPQILKSSDAFGATLMMSTDERDKESSCSLLDTDQEDPEEEDRAKLMKQLSLRRRNE